MIGRILRSLIALVVLVAAVIGAPVALWVLGRQFLPDGIPSGAAIWSALWDKDTGSTFLGLLVIVGTIAWLVFTICVIVEVMARLAGRRRTWRIPGLKVPQSAASALIGTILAGTIMIGGSSMASASPPPMDLHQALAQKAVVTQVMGQATRVTPAKNTPTAASTQSAASRHTRVAATAPAKVGAVWVVARYDTLWSISEKTLGAGEKFQQIADLNVGLPQADGKTLLSASTPLEVGWHLVLPAAATLPTQAAAAPAVPKVAVAATVAAHPEKVQPGDTLSGIAQEQLGDGNAWPTLAKVNHLADPNYLEVGQTIEIPAHVIAQADAAAPVVHPSAPITTPIPVQHHSAAATHAAPAPPTHTAPQGRHVAPPAPVTHPLPVAPKILTRISSTSPAAAPTTVGAPTAAAAAPAPVPARAVAPAAQPTTAAARITPQTATAAPAADTGSDLSTTIGLGMGAVLAGAVWAGLLATRRRRGLRRPLGEIPVALPLPAARMERRMRERAGTVDVGWMDRALRSAASLSASRPAEQLPDVTCVWLSTDELQLQLATPVPAPLPFIAEADSWILPTGSELPDIIGWTDPAAPFPTLASLGDQEGEILLVDLERLGAVTITGDPQRTTELLNHLAVEFAHNLWSDHLEVTMVGWGADLVILNPDRVRHMPTIAGITAALRGRISEAGESQQELDTTVLASRIRDRTDEDIWTPQVLLIDASPDEDLTELQTILQTIAGSGRSTVAVVARGGDLTGAGGAVITIDSDGKLSLPAVLSDNLQIQAAGTPRADLDRLLELFVSTDKFERPGPAKENEPWAVNMDVVGDLVAADLAEPATHREPVDDAQDQWEESAGAPDVGQNRHAQVLPIRSPAAETARAALAAALATDPDLDEDLAEWNSEVVRRPKIGVLGAPMVVSNGVAPSARLSRFTEMVIYLALHKEVSGGKFATDLWNEKSQPSPETRRSDVSRCRSWLGVDEEGRKYLPDARNKPYRLVRLLDLELFKRLRKRATAKLGVGDRAGAAVDLTAALKLVRGPVLAEASKDAYAWLTESDPASVSQAAFTVLGAAHQLVELAIADGDLDLAHTAADAGYEVGPREDLPMRDKARIAHRAGDEAAARGWVLEILRNNGVELPEDLENHETFVVVNEIFPQGLRGA